VALLDGLSSSTKLGGDQALTEVFRGLHAPGSGPSLVVCDLNGETARAREWAIVATRIGKELGGMVPQHPAITTGDLGAASGPVLLAYAAAALAREDEASNGRAWVYASSDDSLRAGATLRLPSPPY
jgi:hypothetical protein